MNLKAYGITDNAESNFAAGFNGSALQCTLDTGDGALFPTTIHSTATSGGTSTTLNCTGIQAMGVAVGDAIRNITDGSEAVVTAVATNSVTTTPLKGGSGNTWDNNDEWAVGSFVITAIHYNTTNTPSSGINKREKILVDYRSGDILYFNTNGRGYDGTSGQTFATNDNVYLFVKKLDYLGLLYGIIDNLSRIVTIENAFINKDGSIPFDNNVAIKAKNNVGANVDLLKFLATNILEFQTLPRNPSSRSISNDYDLIDKKYFDDNSDDTFSVTYGETIAVGEILYFNSGDSKWYKADANDTSKVRARVVAVESGNASDVKRVRKAGTGTVVKEGGGNWTVGQMVYLSDTAGAGSHTPSSTTSVPIGMAITTTTVLLSWGKKMARGTGTSQAANGTNDETKTIGFRAERILLTGKIQSDGVSDISRGTIEYINGVFGGGFAYSKLATVDFGYMPSSGITDTSGGKTSTLSINSVTDTTFVIRTVNSGGAAGSSDINWIAIGE